MSFESDLIANIAADLATETHARLPSLDTSIVPYHALLAAGIGSGIFASYGTGGGGGGGATLPIVLTTDVSGVLPIANGGTGSATAPAGGFAGLTALASGDASTLSSAETYADSGDATEASARAAGDAASVSTAAADATAKQLAAEAAAVHELQIMSGYLAVSSTSFTRVGARAIDMSKYPTIAGYTRHVRLLVDVDKSTGATSGTVQLVDTTHSSALVTSTSLTTTSNVNEEKDSGDLTVGASSGNIRSDVVSQYELQMKRTGGVDGTDAVYITNARILIYYV